MFNAWIQPEAAHRSALLWALWHAAAAAVLACMVSLASATAVAVSSNGPLALVLVAAYLSLSLCAVRLARRSPLAMVAHLALGTLLLCGLAYAAMRMSVLPASPRLLVAACLLALVAALVPYLSWHLRIPVVAGLLLMGVALAWAQWPKAPAGAPAGGVIGSSLHALSVKRHNGLVGRPAADGGALKSMGAPLLLATGEGRFYWLSSPSRGAGLVAMPLPIPAPSDRAAYLADFTDATKAPRLRLTDIALAPGAQPTRLYAAHQAWDSRRRCYTMRVSVVALAWGEGGTPEADSDWRTLFDSQPCVAADDPFDDSETGGKLAWAPDGHLLLTLGDHGFSGLGGSPPHAQRGDVDYGKILKLDLSSGAAAVFSSGHRNPQGLAVDRRGRIWVSEHGPQGGDEINLVEEGANYGWPAVTYGTSYGTRAWPLNRDGRDHGDFREPAVAFVPGVAPSALIEVRGDEFPRWQGDLLLASLRAQSLFRVRLRGERVIYVETIIIGQRIRDLAQTDDGRIYAWADAGTVVELSRSGADTAFSMNCAGCHAPAFGAAAGPPLAGVVGRDIASFAAFPYSDSLTRLEGVWTEAALDAFLRDPKAYAPGTTMTTAGLDDATRAEVIAHLKAQGR